MKFILVTLIFCVTLFLYLHVYFHIKTSDDFESKLIDLIVFKITKGKNRTISIAIPCQTVLHE